MKKPIAVFSLGLFFLNSTASSFADTGDVFEFFEEEAQVTASKRLQLIKESPVAVEVITSADIEASGAVNIWDLLRFRAGMDVFDGRSVDGNRAIVSVRGFPAEFVQGLQVLIDGRSVYVPITGGVYWQQLPVQMQDIERIEIVRGPNAALYGSNAAQGVINILTKKPADDTHLTVKGSAGNVGNRRGSVALNSAQKDVSFRISHTSGEEDGFKDDGVIGKDLLETHKTNFRSEWTPGEGKTVELLGGYAKDHIAMPTAGDTHGDFTGHFQLAKYLQKVADASSVEVVGSRSDQKFDTHPTANGKDESRTLQYDFEADHHIAWARERFETNYGVGYRNVETRSNQLFFGRGEPRSELYRIFLQQSVKLTNKLSVIGAVSGEASKIYSEQIPYQFAALYALTDNHRLRTSYAYANTIPNFFSRQSSFRSFGNIQFTGNPNIERMAIRSAEIGYIGKINRLDLETNAFYMTFENRETTKFLSFFPTINITFENSGSAIGRGIEFKTRYRFDAKSSVYANYTFERISDSLGLEEIEKGTPNHKANMGFIWGLKKRVSFSGNLGYKDGYVAISDARGTREVIPAYVRADAKLSYQPTEKCEVFVAGQNLFEPRHKEYTDGLEVARSFQVGTEVKFGGAK